MATRSGRPSLDLHNNLLGCLIGWVFYLEITLPPTKLSRFLYQVNEVIVKERQEIDSSLLGSLNQRIKGSKDALHESGERRASKMSSKITIYGDCFLTLPSEGVDWDWFYLLFPSDNESHEGERAESRKRLQVRLTILCEIQPGKKSSKSRQFARTHVEEKAFLAKN